MSDFSMQNALDEHLSHSRASFHTPGHKGNAPWLRDLLRFDLTELPDTGSLFDGTGLTARAEAAATAFYGTAGSFLSTGGCTLPIQAMLRLALPAGGHLLCGRTIHRSALHAMALLDIIPHWLLPDDSAGPCFSGRITPQAVAAALREDERLRAVYLTSPDYFGVMCDIAGIAAVCKQYDVPLLVDNAHGSHLRFLGQDLHPLDCGAALCADSAHKTLPVLTGGAYLHVADKRFLPDARAALALFASTSPSYPVMASLDLCRQWLGQEGAVAFVRLRTRVERLRDLLAGCGFALPQGPVDPLRLAACTAPAGLSADVLGEHLRKCGVEPEYASLSHLILIPTPLNTEGDFEALTRTLTALPAANVHSVTPTAAAHLPQQVLTPRETLLLAHESLPVPLAEGHVSVQAACLCPPGIPLVAPGERIDAKTIENLSANGIQTINVVKQKL